MEAPVGQWEYTNMLMQYVVYISKYDQMYFCGFDRAVKSELIYLFMYLFLTNPLLCLNSKLLLQQISYQYKNTDYGIVTVWYWVSPDTQSKGIVWELEITGPIIL